MAYFRKTNPGTAMPGHSFMDRNENTEENEIFIDTTGTNPVNNKSVSETSGLLIDSTLNWSKCNTTYSLTDAVNNIKNELDELAENIIKKKKIKRIKISFSSK